MRPAQSETRDAALWNMISTNLQDLPTLPI
jgi:hypothetical protein